MNESSQTSIRKQPHIWQYSLAATLFWTVLVFGTAGWGLYRERVETLHDALHEAQSSFQGEMLLLFWANGHAEKSGLSNANSMMRQATVRRHDEIGHRSQLVGLDPLRPENAPDAWEAGALTAFKKGITEVSSVDMMDGREYMRVMRPLVTEASCMPCHDIPAYTIGNICGGMSVSVPLAAYQANARSQSALLLIGNGVVWLLGLAGIGFAARRAQAHDLERTRGDEAMRSSEEKFRTLYDSSHDAIMTIDSPLWRFTSGNPAAVSMFKAENEQDLTTREPWALSPERQPDGRSSGEKAKDMIETAMREGSHFFEWTHQRINGESFSATVLLSRMEAAGKVFLQATVRDITEHEQAEGARRELEKQLHEQQKLAAIGTLACGMGHEINNPIMGIINYAQLIKDRLQGKNEALEEFAGEIVIEAERIAGIVRGLSAFATRDIARRAAVPVSDLVESALAPLHDAFTHDHITLAVKVPDDLPAVSCDRQQIAQILTSLLSNASDALNEKYPGSDDDKIVRISARRISDQSPVTSDQLSGETRSGDEDPQMTDHLSLITDFLRITVEDHGTGIPDAVREHIFEPFFTTKDRSVGAGNIGKGLGLFVSYATVQEHGGSLSVETEVEQWTRVHVDLPVGE